MGGGWISTAITSTTCLPGWGKTRGWPSSTASTRLELLARRDAGFGDIATTNSGVPRRDSTVSTGSNTIPLGDTSVNTSKSFNPSNNSITISQSGLYRVVGKVKYISVSDSPWRAYVELEESTQSESLASNDAHVATNDLIGVTASCLARLDEGSEVVLNTYQTSGVDQTVVSGKPNTYLEVERVQ